jgi:hypothetical protein
MVLVASEPQHSFPLDIEAWDSFDAEDESAEPCPSVLHCDYLRVLAKQEQTRVHHLNRSWSPTEAVECNFGTSLVSGIDFQTLPVTTAEVLNFR